MRLIRKMKQAVTKIVSHIKAWVRTRAMAEKLAGSCIRMNFMRWSLSWRPFVTAMTTSSRLSCIKIMSAASLEISVPLLLVEKEILAFYNI